MSLLKIFQENPRHSEAAAAGAELDVGFVGSVEIGAAGGEQAAGPADDLQSGSLARRVGAVVDLHAL